MLEYWPTELGVSWISLAEVEREVTNGATAHLYFIRDSQRDLDEDLACRHGDSDENLSPVVHSPGDERNLKGGSDPMNGSSKRCQGNHKVDSNALVMNSMEIDEDTDKGPISKERTLNRKLRRLLKEYQNVFREELPDGLPPRPAIDHAIETGDASPVNKNAYPLSVQQLR